MSTLRISAAWRLFPALLSIAGFANAAPTEHQINASLVGAGLARNLNWTTEAGQSPIFCGTACAYLEVSTAKIAPHALWQFNPSNWPGNYVTSLPNPASVIDSTPTPTGLLDSQGRPIVYDSTTYERGALDQFINGRTLTAKVFQSGNQTGGANGAAASALSYHVHAQNQSTGARDYFIRFTAPKSLKTMAIPTYVSGPSGSQSFFVSQQKYVKSRSGVDVLVDGLPVWSTESSFFLPEEASSSDSYSGFTGDFGSASDNDAYTIFIGRFDSGEFFNVDFIVRADVESRAPTCLTTTDSIYVTNPKSYVHCLTVTEGRDLPPTSSLQTRFEIYSKVVSTGILQLPGGGQLPGGL